MSYPDPMYPVIIEATVSKVLSLDNFTRRYCIVSTGATTLTAGTSAMYQASAYEEALTQDVNMQAEVEALRKKLRGFFSYAGSTGQVCIVEVGYADGQAYTVENQIDTFKEWLVSKTHRSYVHLVPDAWYTYPNDDVTNGQLLANLAGEYTGPTDATYFMCVITKHENPSASATFAKFSNLKSFMPVYENLADGSNSFAAMVLGKMANYVFDITDTNPSSPLNYKSIEGQQIEDLGVGFRDALTQSCVTYAMEIVGTQVIANGRYANGDTWEYWYQWDLLSFKVEEKLTTLLISGVNAPSTIVPYNQNGIDMIKASVKSVLTTAKNQGIVADFAASFNANTQTLEDTDDITAIDYYTYKAANPQDYSNEVYKGISFYVVIGRYIKQIYINATLA